MKYRILYSSVGRNFDEEVTAALADGWELYGHPFVFGVNHTTFCQALIKR